MRRLAVLALAAVGATAVATIGTLAVTVLPAAAHICPIAVQIPVGKPSTIDVGVTVETTPVPDVEITIPTALRLDRVDPSAGWTFTRAKTATGTTVHYRGGPVGRFECKYFSFLVTAPVSGGFGIPVVQRDAAGTVVANSVPDLNSPTSRILDQFVYAGIAPPKNPSSSSGPSATTIAGIALVVLGVAAAVVVRLRGRRDGYDDDDETGDGELDRDAELQARLERFKKRTPDPRPRE